MENNQNAQNVQTTQAAASAANSQQTAGNQQGAVTVSAESIAAALIPALDARQERTERSVIKSFAEQNGVSVEEITKLVTDYKAKQATAIPADVQRQIDSSPAPAPTVAKCPYSEPTKDIAFGAKGNNVKWLQWHLNHASGEKLAVDGIFGPLTKAAVLRFQKNKKLVQDGIVGPKTRAALKKAVK